jgi:hypothetical protein
MIWVWSVRKAPGKASSSSHATSPVRMVQTGTAEIVL